MAAFSATDAAFEGFKIISARPWAVLGWGALYVFFYAALFGGLFALMGPAAVGMARPNPDATTEEALQTLAVMMPFQLLLNAGGLMIQAVIIASAFRIALRPEEGGLLNMKIGLAELMQLVIMIATGILVFLLIIALVIVALPLGFAIYQAPGALRAALYVLLAIAAFAAMFYVLIRFSLAAPATFAEGNIKIFESWALTRGVVWSLLGAYVLAWAVTIVVYAIAVVAILVLGIVAAVSNPALTAAMKAPQTMDMALLFGPMTLILLIIAAVLISALAGFAYAMMYGPAAHAYRAITAAKTPA